MPGGTFGPNRWTSIHVPEDFASSTNSFPSGTVTVDSASFSWSGSDDLTSSGSLICEYYLSGYESSWTNSGSSTTTTYSGLADGAYTFYVRALDEAGQRDPSPASASFTVQEPVDFESISLSPNGKSLTTNSAGWSLSGVEVTAHFANSASMVYGNRYTWRMISGPGSFNPSSEYYTVDGAGPAIIRYYLTADGITESADYTIAVESATRVLLGRAYVGAVAIPDNTG